MSQSGFDLAQFRLEIPEEVLFRDLGGESVLLHLESGKYFGLDEVGTFFWKALARGESVAEIGQAILGEYEVGPDRLRLDLESLVADLCKHGLLTRVESRP